VRKLLFVRIFAYTTYVHFVINIGVAAYLLYILTKFSNRAAYNACIKTITDADTRKQCQGFLQIANEVYFVVAGSVLLIEMCKPFSSVLVPIQRQFISLIVANIFVFRRRIYCSQIHQPGAKAEAYETREATQPCQCGIIHV
jgi:hypothetical protein